MATFDDEIARRIQEALESGELEQAKGFGKPMPDDPAWDATPEALRMQMKILKDAGVAPPEVALFHERVQLKARIAATQDEAERTKLRNNLAQLEQTIAVRLEMLQRSTKT
jgi:hypothetical protein